ncbi:Mu transposase C-terminal domain-containing protein [Marivivens aquimaris]|uniref:Mu transposase C-terminal domain-containing protein n=1 Tax=Marivivens aquimaris TaxID=2774876 RepID=UPI0038994F5A
MTGDIPFEMEAFQVSFLPSELRKIRRDGIHLFQIRYWSDALAGHIGRGDGKGGRSLRSSRYLNDLGRTGRWPVC